MFAVVKTGGKQYKVAKDDVIKVERLDAEPGDTIALEEVLLVGDGEKSTAGRPTVAGACVAAEVLEQARGRKILVFKKKRRKGYRRLNGHRQDLTVLRVTDILTDGKKPAQAKKTEAKKAGPKKAESKAAEGKDEAKAEPKTAEKKTAAKKTAAKKASTAKTSAAKSGAAKKTAAKSAPTKKTTAPKKTAASKSSASKPAKKSEE
jgi:large subunit ribosomal protein L21